MAAPNPDFALLYAQLGLPPDVTLEQFKHACRQRIAELHPDKRPGDATSQAMDIPLSELMSLYVSAIRFHRRHGRLPGAPVPAARTNPSSQPPLLQPSLPDPATALDPNTSGSRRTWLPSAALMVLLLALLGTLWAPAPQTVPASVETDPRIHALPQVAAKPIQLELGMDKATALAIQGQPVQMDGRVWSYGPSWLRFEKGHLIDWYSSPLHRLKTATPVPSADALQQQQRSR